MLQRKLTRRRQASTAPVVQARRDAEGAGAAAAAPSAGGALGAISDFATGVGDSAQILWELMRLSRYRFATGTFEGELDIGKAAYYTRLVYPSGVLNMLMLDDATRGSNRVYLRLDVYQRSFSLTAERLHVNGFRHPQFQSQDCTLNGVSLSGNRSSASLQVARAEMNRGVFQQQGERVEAQSVGLSALRSQGAYGGDRGSGGLATALTFDEVHVNGLRYPGMPPTDLILSQAGLSFALLWPALTAYRAGSQSTTGGALPAAPDVLPAGSRIQIELHGLRTNASAALGSDAMLSSAGGIGGFDRFLVRLIGAEGNDLASVMVQGFAAVGAGSGGAGSIAHLELKGQPALVQAILNAEQLRSQPSVRQALDVIRACGIEPSAGGLLTLSRVGLSAGADGRVAAKGDLSASFQVPNLGSLELSLSGFNTNVDASAALTAGGSFDRFHARLQDPAGKELAAVELAGAGGSLAGTSGSGGVQSFHVRGDLAGLLKAAEAPLRQLPPQVRGVLKLVEQLGLRGEVSGDLAAGVTDESVRLSGDLDFQLEAGAVGTVAVNLKGVGASAAGGAGSASFQRMTATLKDRADREAASLRVDGGEGRRSEAGLTQATIRQVQLHGDTASITAMLGALDRHASGLPPAVRSACQAARAYRVAASGDIGLGNVQISDDGRGGQTLSGDLSAVVQVAGVGSLTVSVAGFRGQGRGGGEAGAVSFRRLELTLKNRRGAEAAYLAAEGKGQLNANHRGFSAKRVDARGDAAGLSALADAARSKLRVLSAEVQAALATVRDFGLEGQGAVSLRNASISQGEGGTQARADLSASFALTGVGRVDVQLRGFVGSATNHERAVQFDVFEATLKSRRGAQAAHIRVEGTRGQQDEAAEAGHPELIFRARRLQAEGSTEELAALFGGLEGRLKSLPAPVAQAFEAVRVYRQQVAANAAISLEDVELDGGAGGIHAGAGTLRAQAAVRFQDKEGNSYLCPAAHLEISGAQVRLGPDHKPQRIEAQGLTASGRFSSQRGGGNATLRTGAVKILLGPDGQPQRVEADRIQASGELHLPGRAAPAEPDATDPQSPAERAEALRRAQPMAEDVAGLVKGADIHTQTPLYPGRYGKRIRIGVLPGATLNANLVARDHALAAGTGVSFTPPLDLPAWLGLRGVNLEVEGRRGLIRTDLKGFFDINLTRFVTGSRTVSLNITALAREVMKAMQDSIARADTPDPAEEARDAARDERWLRQEHAEWEADAQRHQRGARSAEERRRRAVEDAAEEPRSASMTDLASEKGMDLWGTRGTADLVLSAPRDTTVGGITLPRGQEMHLRGRSEGGGRLSLGVDQLALRTGAGTVGVEGLHTGSVAISTGSAGSHIQFDSFSLDHVRWDAPL